LSANIKSGNSLSLAYRKLGNLASAKESRTIKDDSSVGSNTNELNEESLSLPKPLQSEKPALTWKGRKR
jgi:hypothetical protein